MNSTGPTQTKNAEQNESSKRSKMFGQLKDLKPRGDVKAGWSSQQNTSSSNQLNKIAPGG